MEEAALLTLKMGVRSHEPVHAGGLQKLEKARKWISPYSLQKECSPVLDSRTPNLQNWKVIHVRHLQPLRL